MTIRKQDLEYIALRWERYADQDEAESKQSDIPTDMRLRREARADGLRWAARELREELWDPTPEYLLPDRG